MSDRPTPETYALYEQMMAKNPGNFIHLEEFLELACRLERERDEARELLESEKITRNHIIKRSVEVERERDEAREALRQIWQSGDAFLPHVDQETTNRWRKAAGWEETK